MFVFGFDRMRGKGLIHANRTYFFFKKSCVRARIR